MTDGMVAAQKTLRDYSNAMKERKRFSGSASGPSFSLIAIVFWYRNPTLLRLFTNWYWGMSLPRLLAFAISLESDQVVRNRPARSGVSVLAAILLENA